MISIHSKLIFYYYFGYLLTNDIHTSSYTTLPSIFYQEISPTPISRPYVVKFNQELAASLNLENDIELYAGNKVPPHLTSIAQAYSGHQFGHYVPLLGDGRAVLLGQATGQDNLPWDIQLKGAGPTAFSRMGDGRAPLSAVLREYLISEAMHGLGIATTRSLAIIASDDTIYRQEGAVPLGVLTRVASSYIRVGTFEYAASYGNPLIIKNLADYTIKRHYPHLLQHPAPYLELFKAVIERQASLIADWMGVGFIHGVMNTDNMTISGETIDYGPCAFMDEFNLNTVFSSIDVAGRYAFNNQAHIAYWNLTRFCETLQPLFTNQDAQHQLQETLNSFPERFTHYWNKKIHAKLGLHHEENADTSKLIERFIVLLQRYQPDFTNTFRQLSDAIDSVHHQTLLLQTLDNQQDSKKWLTDWLAYIKQQTVDIKQIKIAMNLANPAYIPRNHLVDKAIRDCVENKDHILMNELLDVWRHPYQQQHNTEHLKCLPLAFERISQTFCGT